jgi:hypothetical protein
VLEFFDDRFSIALKGWAEHAWLRGRGSEGAGKGRSRDRPESRNRSNHCLEIGVRHFRRTRHNTTVVDAAANDGQARGLTHLTPQLPRRCSGFYFVSI